MQSLVADSSQVDGIRFQDGLVETARHSRLGCNGKHGDVGEAHDGIAKKGLEQGRVGTSKLKHVVLKLIQEPPHTRRMKGQRGKPTYSQVWEQEGVEVKGLSTLPELNDQLQRHPLNPTAARGEGEQSKDGEKSRR